MKKIRILAFLLVTVLCGACFFSACKKQDNSPVTSVEDVKEHYGEVAEIALALQYLTEDCGDSYDQLKEQAQAEIESYINQKAGQFFEPFVTEVVAQSDIKNSYLTDYLNAVKEYAIAKANLSLKAKEIYNKYNAKHIELAGVQNKTSEQEKLLENYRAITEICDKINSENIEYNGIEGVFALIVKAPFDISDSGMGLSLQVYLATVREGFEGDDYTSVSQAFKSLYLAEKEIVEIFDLSSYVKVILNLVLNEEVLNKAITSLSLDVFAEQEELKQAVEILKRDFKLEQESKKQAYVESVSLLLNNFYHYALNPVYALDFDTAVLAAEAYADNKEDEMFEQIDTLVGDAAQALFKAALTQEQVQGFVESCNIIDKNGVGFFAEKYFPLFASVQELLPRYLSELTADRMQALTRVLLLEDDAYNANKKQLNYFSLILLSETVVNGYQQCDSDRLLTAWEKAFGDSSIITDTVDCLKAVAQECPTNISEALKSLADGDQCFTTAQIESVSAKFVFVGFVWKTNEFVKEDMQEATSAVKEYISPVIAVTEVFMGENAFEKITDKIPSSDSLNGYLNKILGEFI